MQIIDVSSYNTITNWHAVAGEVQAVWAKATQGNGYVSPAFAGQWSGAGNAGLLRGAYHFADSNVSAEGNWAHFRGSAGVEPFADGSLAPMLDMEDSAPGGIHWTSTSAPAFIAAFIAAYRRDTGHRAVVVYANQSDWQNKMHPERWADRDTYLMLARYTTPPAPGDTGGFTHEQLAVHQFTDRAVILGSAGVLDLSVQVAFTPADLTLGSQPPAPDEGDDDVKLYPHEIYLAGPHDDQNGGKPLFPFGVWRNDQGMWVGLASQAEQDSIAKAYDLTPKWLEQITLAELVRLSRVGVDIPLPA